MRQGSATAILLGMFVIVVAGCSRSNFEAIPPLREKVRDLETVERLSEEVAHRLIEFSDALRRRDHGTARRYLAADFAGSAFPAEPSLVAVPLPLGAERGLAEHAAGELASVDRDGFLIHLSQHLSSLESIEHVYLKTRGAEFESAAAVADVQRGIVQLTLHVIGRASGDRPRSLYAWAAGEVTKVTGDWQLRRFRLEKTQILRRERPMFQDVATASGVAHAAPPFRLQRKPTLYWQGAATADIDGDGLYDIFTSTPERNFLYQNRGDGHFDDVAPRVLSTPPPGVTGPVFFDYDSDGDPDLFLGYVGWEEDGVPRGDTLKLFRNDAAAQGFEDVSVAAGIAQPRVAFSSVVADTDNDGALDIYVCAYNRLEQTYPNHWFAATNGTPNALFRNRGDGSFEEVAAAAGVTGNSWSYAAAFADFDEDGDQDLYVANDYGTNNLYVNDGGGAFADRAGPYGVLDSGNGMGAAWGDLDNDGRLDLYVSNMSSSAGKRILARLVTEEHSRTAKTLHKGAAGNSIFRQQRGGFAMLPPSSGGVQASWAWGVALLDLDLDGILDIYVANGFISGDSLKDT